MYTFVKQFRHEDPEDLLLRTWETLITEEGFRRTCFDQSVGFRLFVLQVVNDNLLVIRRDHIHPGFQFTYSTVHLLVRLQVETGFLMVLRTLHVPEVQEHLGSNEAWFDLFHWTFFDYIRDDQGDCVGCEVRVGGSLADQTEVIAQHWLYESMMSVYDGKARS